MRTRDHHRLVFADRQTTDDAAELRELLVARRIAARAVGAGQRIDQRDARSALDLFDRVVDVAEQGDPAHAVVTRFATPVDDVLLAAVDDREPATLVCDGKADDERADEVGRPRRILVPLELATLLVDDDVLEPSVEMTAR